jgi:heterodisulfide reductase subunit C
MSRPHAELKAKISAMLSAKDVNRADYCYQCAKCTSGCEAMKLLELEPHHVMALVKSGFIEELVNSEIIWTCVTCYKCKERCPQRVAPIDVLFSLKNIAIASGKQVPGNYTALLQSVLTTGYIQTPKHVLARDRKSYSRENLGLHPLTQPKELMKFQQVLTKVATEPLI